MSAIFRSSAGSGACRCSRWSRALAEVATSALLIAARRASPTAAPMAEWSDLASIAATVLTTHVLVLSVYGGILALVVQGIRRSMTAAGDLVIDDPKDDQ